MKRNFLFFCVVLFLLTVLHAQIPQNYHSLQQLAASTDSQLSWDSLTENGMLEKQGHYLTFSVDSPLVIFDYVKAATVSKPIKHEGTVFVSNDFLDMAEKFFSSIPSEPSFRIGAIIIDAGHGGKDPGATRDYVFDGKKVTLNEKDIALSVALDLHDKLTKTYRDKKILLTRDDDTFLALEERTDIANTVELKEHEAILYVSVHVNSALNKTANGFEVWYLSPGYRRTLIDKEDTKDVENDVANILNSMLEEEFTTESVLIAKYILDGMDAQIGDLSPNRGLKEEEWFVVRNAKMPSVLIELGFISNEKEAALMYDKDYLHKLSLGIYNGLTAFVTHFEQSRGFTGSLGNL